MNHKYSTFALLLFLLIGGSVFVLGELTSEEVDSIDVTCLQGNSVLYKPESTMTWQCASLNDTQFNITVDEIRNILTNKSIFWGDYNSANYNMATINASSTYWRVDFGDNLTTNREVYFNDSVIFADTVDFANLEVGYPGDTGYIYVGGGNNELFETYNHTNIYSGYMDMLGGLNSLFFTPTYIRFSDARAEWGLYPIEIISNFDSGSNIIKPSILLRSTDGNDESIEFNVTGVYGNEMSSLYLDGQANITGNITADYYYGDGSKLTGITSGGVTYGVDNDTLRNVSNALSVNTTKYFLLNNDSGTAGLVADDINISTDYMYIGDAQSSSVSTSTGSSSDKVVIYKNNPGLTSRVLMVLMNFNHTSNSNLPSSGLNAFAWHTGTGNLTRTADFGGFAAGRYLAILNGVGGVSRGGGVSAKGLDNRDTTFRSSGFSYDFNAEGCIVSTQNITTCVNYDTTPHQDTSTGVIQNAIGHYIEKQTVGTLTNKEVFMDGASGVYFRDFTSDDIYIRSDETDNLTISASDTVNIDDTLRLVPRSSAPSGSLGDLYVDSDTNELCFYDGSAWTGLKAGGTCA